MRLTNQEIWLAYPNLIKLSEAALPVEVSLGIAISISRLAAPYTAIERVRRSLVTRYGVEAEDGKSIHVGEDNPLYSDYSIEFAHLCVAEWPDDIPIAKVYTTEDIPPQILIPLAEHFVEVGPAPALPERVGAGYPKQREDLLGKAG